MAAAGVSCLPLTGIDLEESFMKLRQSIFVGPQVLKVLIDSYGKIIKKMLGANLKKFFLYSESIRWKKFKASRWFNLEAMRDAYSEMVPKDFKNS